MSTKQKLQQKLHERRAEEQRAAARAKLPPQFLFSAAAQGHTQATAQALAVRFPLEWKHPQAGGTAMHAAACNGHHHIVKMLLQAGANVSPVDAAGETPLDTTASRKHFTTMKMLIDAGADPTPAFRRAFVNGHAQAARKLAMWGADVDAALDPAGRTVLMHAAERAGPGEVKFLVGCGANLDAAASKDGATPLYLAAQAGRAENVGQLLDLGATVDKPTSHGGTPLMAAALQGHADAARLLLDRGASLEHASAQGHTPLLAAVTAGRLEVVKMLLARGASPEVVAEGGGNALHYAIAGEHEDVAYALLQHGGLSSKTLLTAANMAGQHGAVVLGNQLREAGEQRLREENE